MTITKLPSLPPRNATTFVAAVEARMTAEVVFSEELAILEVAAARTEAAVAAAMAAGLPSAAANAATATAQASLATAAAASASSVLQQDLSAFSGALHRSPNTITAQFIYDTSLDSDGGAWVERMQHTSWFNEPLNGAWRGQCATEAAARAIAGAATGDYFQLTTDGRFYRLSATSGTTEVFRGNKAKFPRLAAIVAEADSVTIYDLTGAGRPMWMRIVGSPTAYATDGYEFSASSVAALNGVVVVGLLNTVNEPGLFGGALMHRFTADDTIKARGNYLESGTGTRATVRANTNFNYQNLRRSPSWMLADGRVYAVALTALPDAPIDLATGLPVPTIAVGTAGGLSVIKHDGTVVNSQPWPVTNVAFDPRGNVVSAGENSTHYRKSLAPGYSVVLAYGGGPLALQLAPNLAYFGRVGGNLTALIRTDFLKFGFFKENDPKSSASLWAEVAANYATGYLVGDIRRAYLVSANSLYTAFAASADRSINGSNATVFGALTAAVVAPAAQMVAHSGFSAVNYIQQGYSAGLDFGTGDWDVSACVSYTAAAAASLVDRSAATGAHIKLGIDSVGKFIVTAFDGTTTRTVTTPVAYNTGVFTKVNASYSAGNLSISVNGVEVVAVTGAPLLTLSNAAAVLTIGNSLALTAPFSGTMALVKISATVPTPEQALWMWAQERQMFGAGAQVTLPVNDGITDLDYDKSQDKWVVQQVGFESSFTGLVRTAVATSSPGQFSKVQAQSGVRLSARTTAAPGVDVQLPAYGLREELLRRAEAAAQASKTLTVFDFDTVGFTATTAVGSAQITAVAVVSGTPFVGMGVTGAGLPANTTIAGINGTTYTLSAAATAAATLVACGQSTFALPAGWSATEVLSAGASKREGPTRDFVRLNGGFIESLRFAVTPGAAAWVQITAKRN